MKIGLEFYDETERKPIEQISKRVSENGGDWQGWSPFDILDPSRHRYHFNKDNILPHHFGIGRIRPNQQLYEPLNECEVFIMFKELLREYDPFIVIDRYTDETTGSDWVLPLWNAANKRNFKPSSGLGYFNFFNFETGKRTAQQIDVMLVTCRKSGIYAEVVDCGEIHGNKMKPKAMKLLMLRNPRRVNPFAMRRFIKTLKTLLLEDLSYLLVWGNAATCDQVDHPHNCEGKDKRFDVYETRSIRLTADESISFKVSNLTHYWCSVGLSLLLSPESQALCVGFVSLEMQEQLLKEDELVWSQFFDRAAYA